MTLDPLTVPGPDATTRRSRDSPPATPALELRNLVKEFGPVTAVAGIDLSVGQGEFVTLLGPSGSGKTTILRMIAGFEVPTAGDIFLEGRDISSLAPAKREIGVVFQQYALFPHMTVAQNIRYPLKLRRWPRAKAARRVDEVLAMVRLEGLGGRYPRQLSGGQQQRVALARALAFHPTLLLMDEPLGALDRALRMEMEEELRRIHRESGTTVVYVTHDQEEALTLSDRIGVMREGSLLQVGSPQNLFESPAERFIATFFGECTLIPARTTGSVDGGRRAVDVLGQHAVVRQGAALDGPDVLVAVRPSRLRLRARPGDLVVESDVVDVLYLGEVARLVCRHDEASTVIVRADARDAMSVAPGGRLRLGFSPDDAVLVPR